MATTKIKPEAEVVENAAEVADLAPAVADEPGNQESPVSEAGLPDTEAAVDPAPEVSDEVQRPDTADAEAESPVEEKVVVDISDVPQTTPEPKFKIVQDEDQSIDLTPIHDSISGDVLELDVMESVQDGTIISEGIKVFRGQRYHYVAVKRTPGWSIVLSDENFDADRVMKEGEMIDGEGDIKFLVPCTEEAFTAYNYSR